MSDQRDQQRQQSSSGEGPSALPRGLLGRRGGAVSPSTRLPSLRPARDLTLGGVQKRAFKPNLNLAGRKDKGQRESTSKDASTPSTPKQQGQRSEKGDRGRGRGRGRGKPDTIQSHSIFEQGPADRLNKKGGGHSGGGGGDAGTPSSATKTMKREKMTEEASRRIQEVLRDDFVSDLSKDDDDDGNKKYCPIHLPLVSSLSLKKEARVEEKGAPKMEVDEEEIKVIKREPDSEDVEMTDVDTKPAPESLSVPPKVTKKSLPERTTCATLFGSHLKSEGELMFFQLPDTLPGQPVSRDDEDSRPKAKRDPGTQVTEQESQKKPQEESKPAKCTLESLPEGYLGKLQVLESGKTRLVLGDVTLNVAMGTPCGFLQDLMSIRLDDDERTGEMTRLGQVKHRIVCTPDFESLLQPAPSK